MSTSSDGGAGGSALAWDHRNCTGMAECPPRCPRFADKEGTPLFITPGADSTFEALVQFYDEYPSRYRSMSLPPLTRPQVERWVGKLTEQGQNLMAFHDDRLVGHVAYLTTGESAPELIVFIDGAYQNRGLGTELCRQAMAHAAADGHSALRLHVDAENERALAVYESLGFETVDRTGDRIEMRVALNEDLVRAVQAPPAERL